MKSKLLVEALKKELKKRSVTYAVLAQKVGLTEAAIKRAFAAQNFSLRRLDQFCDAIEIDLSDLLSMATDHSTESRYFDLATEAQLALKPQLLLAFYLILLGHVPKDLQKHLGCDKLQIFKIGRELEKLGLVQVMPGDRIKPRVKKSIRWNINGPLAQKFGIHLKEEFFNSSFTAADEHQDFLTGSLALSSYKIIKRKQVELFKLFDELSDLDSKLKDDLLKGYWIYSGIRPWAPLNVIKKSEVPSHSCK
jgi:DNA-binding Xre family transcriptional regulator